MTAAVDPFLGIIELVSDIVCPASAFVDIDIHISTTAGTVIVDSDAVIRALSNVTTRIYLSPVQWRLLIRATELSWQPVILTTAYDKTHSPLRIQTPAVTADVQGSRFLNDFCQFLISHL